MTPGLKTENTKMSFFSTSFHPKILKALKDKTLITVFFHSRNLIDSKSLQITRDSDQIKLKILTVTKKMQHFLPFPASAGVLAVTWCLPAELDQVKTRIEQEEGFVLAFWSGEDQAWKSFTTIETSLDQPLPRDLLVLKFLAFISLYFKKNI